MMGAAIRFTWKQLAGLVCVCGKQGGEGSPSIPLGNPVKDSMAAKINGHTIGVIGAVYGTTTVLSTPEMDRLLVEFSRLLEEYVSRSAGAAACSPAKEPARRFCQSPRPAAGENCRGTECRLT